MNLRKAKKKKYNLTRDQAQIIIAKFFRAYK